MIVVRRADHASQHWIKHKKGCGATDSAPTPVVQDKRIEEAVAVSLVVANVAYRSGVGVHYQARPPLAYQPDCLAGTTDYQ